MIIGFQATVKNVGDAFWGTQCNYTIVLYIAPDSPLPSSDSESDGMNGHRFALCTILHCLAV